MKAIMYHYVRPLDQKNGNLRYLTTDQFRKQLDFFEKNYGLMTPQEFKFNFENKINSQKVILTFDDGLLDHYEYVYPILKKRGIKGYFFIPTSILNNNFLNVHKVHYLLMNFNSKEIYLNLNKLLIKKKIRFKNSVNSLAYNFSSHEKYELEIKKTLNYELKFETSEEIINELYKYFKIKEDRQKELYVNYNQIESMFNDGHIIGSHTIDHKILSSLNKKDQIREIKNSFKDINRFIRDGYKYFSYPYGYKFTYNKKTISVLEKLNVNNAFIFDNNEINSFNQFEISREDCNKFIY